MICPLHDTHIDNCIHEERAHDSVCDNWEIRIPIRCSVTDVLALGLEIEMALKTVLNREHTPVNIGVKGE